ncbi:MAG: alpha/beta hydrolase family esterase, partial [Bacteroidota bacterium]
NWNDGRPTTPNQLGIDDVSFLNSVWYYLTLNYPVDDTRIYTTGISNGGFMSSRIGCELSNRIAAIAVVAATMEATTIAPGCVPGRPVPAMYIHGTSDSLVPFTGGEMTAGGTAGGTILSHTQAVEKWVTNNNCNPVPVVTDLPDISNDGTTIKQRVFGGGTNGSEVVSYVVLNGGHTWPQGLQYLNELIIGKTSQDMNACEVIWTFFKRFNRTE